MSGHGNGLGSSRIYKAPQSLLVRFWGFHKLFFSLGVSQGDFRILLPTLSLVEWGCGFCEVNVDFKKVQVLPELHVASHVA